MKKVAPHVHQGADDNELDLIELVQLLWKNRLTIILFTAIVTGTSLLYALYSTPTYQVQTTALPVSESELSRYNQVALLDSSLNPLNPEQAFSIFLRYLNSNQLRRDFFESFYLPNQFEGTPDALQSEQLWREFNTILNIDAPSQKGPIKATVKFEGPSPQLITLWANQYMELALNAAKNNASNNIKSAISTKLASLNTRIATLRQAAEQERRNQIIRLQEALSLANEINLQLPPSSGNLITSYSGEMSYLRGYQALQAELDILTNRKNNDPFTPELPALLKQKALLESIEIPEGFSMATIDEIAVMPELPSKPNKKLIVAIGVLLGAMISVFFVLIRQAFRNSSQP